MHVIKLLYPSSQCVTVINRVCIYYQVAMVGLCLIFATPLCCAFFPQQTSMMVHSLEAEARDQILVRIPVSAAIAVGKNQESLLMMMMAASAPTASAATITSGLGSDNGVTTARIFFDDNQIIEYSHLK